MDFTPTDRLETVTLDPKSVRDLVPDEVQERRVAIYDLVRDNQFAPIGKAEVQGPYALHFSLIENHLVFDIRAAQTGMQVAAHIVSLSPFKQDLRNYATVKQNYYEAIKYYGVGQIEALDMGRRAIHNDASQKLIDRLENKIAMNMDTARRLFTLIASLKPAMYASDAPKDKTTSVLFVCVMNAVRSPVAAALARNLFVPHILARSAGVRSGQVDGMAVEVMDELGIDLTVHTPHSIDELTHDRFDLIVALSEEAHQLVQNHPQFKNTEVDYWPTTDPTLTEGSREQRLFAYREMRDGLKEHIKARFGSQFTKQTR